MTIRNAAAAQRLAVRLGVHVGEVELAGDDVRGMAVHEADRVMATAGRDEILVTEAVRLLCKDTDLVSRMRGSTISRASPTAGTSTGYRAHRNRGRALQFGFRELVRQAR